MQGTDTFVAYETERLKITVEYTEEHVFLHMPEATSVTPGDIKNLRSKLKDFYRFIRTAGYPVIIVTEKKENNSGGRIAKMVGFIYVGDHSGASIYTYGETPCLLSN